MFYKGPNDRVTRALRRIWLVEVYEGDPDDPEVTTRVESIIAWNACDAIRRCGTMKLASQPIADSYVTWDDKPLLIESPKKGPTKKKAKPTIGSQDAQDF